MLAVNFALVVGIWTVVLGPVEHVPRWAWVFVPVFLMGLCNVLFVRNGRHVRILQLFHERSPAERRRIRIFAWAYVFSSIAVPAVFAFIMARLKGQL